MKENQKLVREILADIQRDMSDEEILSLLASSRISEKELAAMLRALLTARGVELETDGSDQ